MNRAERRAALKQQQRLQRFDRIAADYNRQAKKVAYHEINLMWAGTFVALHNSFGWGETRCRRLYDEIKRVMTSALSAQQLREECKRLVGLDVEMIVDSSEDVEEELRNGNYSGADVERWCGGE